MKTMISLSGLVFAALLMYSCGTKNYLQEEGFCTATPNGDSVILMHNQPLPLFTSCDENIQAKVIAVSDSRCPEGVNCVWAGRLTVDLEMDQLRLTLEKDKVVDTFYRDHRYTFNLVNALPLPSYPDSTNPRDQKIYINIMRANRSRPVDPGNTLPIASDSTAKPKS